jgi:hypothetical protein
VSGQLHTPADLSPGKSPCIEGWVGPRADLYAVVRIILSGLEPPIIQPVAQRYTTEYTFNKVHLKGTGKLTLCTKVYPKVSGMSHKYTLKQ